MTHYAITIHDLTKIYKGNKFVLNKFSAHALKGNLLGLIGPNGAGKSTLIHLIAGVIRPTTGMIQLSIQSSEKLAWVSQTTTLDWYLTVLDNVRLGARLGGLSVKESYHAAKQAMEILGIAEYSHTGVDELSGGQQRKVQIARALAQQADILILDEPTIGLDYKSSDLFIKFLQDLTKQGKTIIISSHDLTLLEKYIDHVWVLDNGLLKTDQNLSTLLQATNHSCKIDLVVDYEGALDDFFLSALQSKGFYIYNKKPLSVSCNEDIDTNEFIKSLLENVKISSIQSKKWISFRFITN